MANAPDSPKRQRRRSSSIFRMTGLDQSHHSTFPHGTAHQPNAIEGTRSSFELEFDMEEEHSENGWMRDGRSFDDNDDDDDDDDEETGLTQPERRSRRRQRLLHQRLDERVAGSSAENGLHGSHTPDSKDPIANYNTVRDLMINGSLIALWYSFSISISVYNKWMFSAENLDFHFPLFTTSAHMIVQFLLASLSLWIFPQFRPRRPDAGGDYTQISSSSAGPPAFPPTRKPLMSRAFYLTRVGPCGAATALDIGLGNFSLRFITLTFFTMCKSSVLAFVLLFAFLFRLETPTWRLCLVILIMTGGVIMMVAGEAAFNALGFVLVMTASLCSGFRWSLTQILLLRNPATSNPFSSIFFLTPIMFLALFVLAVAIEGPFALAAGVHALADTHGAAYSVLIMLFPGLLAFLMVAAEFTLIQRTSVVTLSVCGIFKEVLTISAASVVFGDPLSPINVSGLIVTLLSIGGYKYLKYVTRTAAAAAAAVPRNADGRGDAGSPMLEMQDLASARSKHHGGIARGLEKFEPSPSPPRRTSADAWLSDEEDDAPPRGNAVHVANGHGAAAVRGKRLEHVD